MSPDDVTQGLEAVDPLPHRRPAQTQLGRQPLSGDGVRRAPQDLQHRGQRTLRASAWFFMDIWFHLGIGPAYV